MTGIPTVRYRPRADGPPIATLSFANLESTDPDAELVRKYGLTGQQLAVALEGQEGVVRRSPRPLTDGDDFESAACTSRFRFTYGDPASVVLLGWEVLSIRERQPVG